MRVLLSDGPGLTARQAATQLASGGHAVHVLSPDPICLARDLAVALTMIPEDR